VSGLAAQLAAARALVAEFDHAARADLTGGREQHDWLAWALRLSSVLQSVLNQVTDASRTGGPPPPGAASYMAPSGECYLTEADGLTVLGALGDAAEYRSNHPDDDDRRLIVAYLRLARSLGGDS
jgi:hypothetical protein